MTLTVDTPASSVEPDDGDVAAWMTEQRVFLSSTMVQICIDGCPLALSAAWP